MPKGRYTVGARGTHGCSGYPVLGDTGKVHGCHKTRASARAQQAAIYTSTAKDNSYDVDSAILKCCPDSEIEKAQGPCWEGYEQVGWKTKDGRRVPNCVPKDKTTKAAGDRFEIIEEHPKCEGVALVEKDGTTVLCYLNREEAEKALADMRLEEPEASMRPDPDTAKSMDEDDEDGESHDKKKKKKKSEFWRGAFA
jgi:Zn-finger nucleic acid-binding protein